MKMKQKEKAMDKMRAGMLNDYQVASNRAQTSISIELKEIDGEKKLVARCDGFGDGPYTIGPMGASKKPERQPVAKEYTDIEEFAEYVANQIRKAGKELMA